MPVRIQYRKRSPALKNHEPEVWKAVKGVFQYIFIIFLIPFAILAAYSFYKKNRTACYRSVVYILVTAFCVNIAVIFFKAANKKYNGKFEFTNRAAQLLYGNTVKRTDKISKKSISGSYSVYSWWRGLPEVF